MGRQYGDSKEDLGDGDGDGKAIIANPLWKPKAPEGESVRSGATEDGSGGPCCHG